jgi:hypothetical protein
MRGLAAAYAARSTSRNHSYSGMRFGATACSETGIADEAGKLDPGVNLGVGWVLGQLGKAALIRSAGESRRSSPRLAITAEAI